MLENRETMMQLFPELFQQIKVRPVENYPQLLRQSLAARAPRRAAQGTPTRRGADAGHLQLGLFRARLPRRPDGRRTGRGPGSARRRRQGRRCARPRATSRSTCSTAASTTTILDPLTFQPDSALGVPGIMDVYRAGNITIANAPGTGIADDKAIYSYMPEIVEFYTGRKALLENVPTWRCSEPDSLKYVLEHLAELVVKEVHGSGGYGMLVGPTATKKERDGFRREARARSPPTTSPSRRCRCRPADPRRQAGLAPRHVDLRPLRAGLRPDPDHPGRADPRGAEGRLAGGQLQSRAAAPRIPGCWRTDGTRDTACSGRTANGLYWMFRYIERAENMARLVDAGLRMALTRTAERATRSGTSVLLSAGVRRRLRRRSIQDYTGRQRVRLPAARHGQPVERRCRRSRRRATMPAWCAPR